MSVISEGAHQATRAPLIPGQTWAYAFRIALAAIIALYVAFWLQLGGASSAAVTVIILSQSERGLALAKAAYRIAGTLLGAAASLLESSDGDLRTAIVMAMTGRL